MTALSGIQGFGIGHLSTNIPIYGTEVTPPHIRGLLVSLYSFGLAVGQVTVAAVCVGSSGIVGASGGNLR